MPPIFYLQLDNCFRENKNSYLFAYLAWLVERRVFDAVYVSYLPVGHTHNEADQCASCFGLACRHNDVTCLADLMALLRKSFYPEPVVEYVAEVADVKRLMNPNLCKHYGPTSHIKQLTRVSAPLHFEVRRSRASDRAFIRTKARADQEQWSEAFVPLRYNHSERRQGRLYCQSV